jgi:hypothetical protein
MANVTVKETAERTETLKSYLKANIRNPEVIGSEQLFGLLDAAFDQILMRRLVKCLAKQP